MTRHNQQKFHRVKCPAGLLGVGNQRNMLILGLLDFLGVEKIVTFFTLHVLFNVFFVQQYALDILTTISIVYLAIVIHPK